jgi:hypothetical protein
MLGVAPKSRNTMRRRHLLALLIAAAAAPSDALAAGGHTIAINRMFPFLSMFLRTPFADRNRFYLAYRAVRDKRPIADARASFVGANGARTPVVFDHTGAVAPLPTLAELNSGAVVVFDEAPFQLEMELRCTMANATRLDVGELGRSLAQVNQTVSKLAGPLSLFTPKITAAYFPDAGTAVAIMADGSQLALPVYFAPGVGAVPYIEPASLGGARTVVLAKPPSRIVLAGHPRSA